MENVELPQKESEVTEAAAEDQKPEMTAGWTMEKPAKLIMTIQLDRVGQATALGCAEIVKDVIKSWHSQMAQAKREQEVTILKPSAGAFGKLTAGLRKMAGR